MILSPMYAAKTALLNDRLCQKKLIDERILFQAATVAHLGRSGLRTMASLGEVLPATRQQVAVTGRQ